MIIAQATTQSIKIVASATCDLDIVATSTDRDQTTHAVEGSQTEFTNITTTTPAAIMSAPASGKDRALLEMYCRNAGASAVDVTVYVDVNGTLYETIKETLLAGETLQYTELTGFFKISSGRLDRSMRLASNYVNATTSFSDITGLICPVNNGKIYNFLAHLYHNNDANTTGSRFAINGPAMTAFRSTTIDTVTTSVTASAHSAGSVTALDTAATAQTTGNTNVRLAILSGTAVPSAAGNLQVRGQSEVAVANGLTVHAGSWFHVWEPTG